MENKKDNLTFEEKMAQLEQIVDQLEQGNVPLEKALTQFQKGMKLGKELQDELQNAEKTVTQVIDDQGNEKPFEKDDPDE